MITEAEIDAKLTAKGGWTKKDLATWGVPWPPPKGWKDALIRGKPILDTENLPRSCPAQ